MSSSRERELPEPADSAGWAQRGSWHLVRGEFQAAIDAYERAKETAAGAEERDKADLNVSMVRLQMGDARQGQRGLREILMRVTEPRVAFHSAYNLACTLRRQGRYERALSYARRAMEHAQALEAPELIAPVHNLLGNVYLNQSYLDEALAEYGTALALRERGEGDTRFSRAILEENIGYCLILKRQLPEGRARLAKALALADETGDHRCRAECLQDLCYAYLLDGRLDQAVEQGTYALEAAREGRFTDIEENCHYLLGELGTRTGRLDLRDMHFEALQKLHPEVLMLREFLCTVDVTDVITLKR